MKNFNMLCLACLAGLVITLRAEEPATPAMDPDLKTPPAMIEIRPVEGGWKMFRNGQPYYIKGAGAKMHLDELVEAGGNSIRTWKAAYIKPLLDRAHRKGLTATVGLWLGHERHGFDYSDKKAVERQFRKAERQVKELRNHPALLMWGIGNETEWIKGTNTLIYEAINDIAEMIKKEDPNHPTMTVLAELDPYGVKIKNLLKHCPAIDILGINSFGGLESLPERLKKAGWEKPYIVTEFGPRGPWECKTTDWGAELEANSTDKGKHYFISYMKGIYKQQPVCLGSYAFYWGTKNECTATWFSMLQHDGTRMAPVEYMTAAWKRQWPENRCPTISKIQSRVAQARVRKGGVFKASVVAEDPDGDALSYRWEVMEETRHKDKAGITKTTSRPIRKAITEDGGNNITFTIPDKAGAYRLYCYVYDGHGNGAYANMPFYAQ